MHHAPEREPMSFAAYLPRYDYSSYTALEAGKTPEGDRPPLTRVLCNGTLYEVRTDPAATYIAKAPPWRPVPEGKKVYTARAIREGYYARVPRAPVSLLAEIIGLFRQTPHQEAHVNLVYDRERARYDLVCTEVAGSASAGRVSYEHLPHTEERFVVAEIHSHHAMNAYFSSTDNEAERRSGVYGVIGRIDRDRPHAAFRYSCGGVFGPLYASEIFMPEATTKALVGEVEPEWPEPSP